MMLCSLNSSRENVENKKLFLFLFAILIGLTYPSLGLSADEKDISALMNLSLQELLQIKVTSVTRLPEKLSNSPSAIQVITREQIQRSGATRITEALRLAGNLNIAQKNSSEWVVSSRGFSSDVGNKLLVMVDGRTIYTPLFSGVIWDRHNYLMEDIELIEVISGPGATLWGANAVNGVINIITRNSENSQGAFVDLGVGTSLENKLGARFGGKITSDTNFRVYGNAFERGPEYLSNGDEGNFSWRAAQGGFRLDSEINSKTQWTLQGDYFSNKAELTSIDDHSTAKGGNLLSRWTQTLENESKIQFQLFFDQTDIRLPSLPVYIDTTLIAPAGVFYDKLDTVDVDFQFSLPQTGRHKVIWGAAYRYTNDAVENSPGLAFYPTQLEQDLYSAFFQDEIELLKNKLNLTLGTKYEHNDYTGAEWEPGVRLQWFLAPNKILWSAISRAVRMPSRIDHDFSQPSRDYLVILQGGNKFESENVIAYEVGYRTYFSDSLMFSLASYYNEYSNIRSASLTPETFLPVFFENNLEGNTWGLELDLDTQPTDWLRLDFTWSYLEEDLDVKPGAFDLNNALNETADPKHQISLHSFFDINENMNIYLGARWIDKLPTNNSGSLVYVPSYTELDLGFNWKIKPEIEASLSGRNLLNEYHQEFGIPSPSQEEVGRNVFLRIRWRQ